MKTITLAAACVAAGIMAASTTVAAHEHGKKSPGHPEMSASIRVENAWARATPGLAKNGGAYFTAVNTGREADRIVGVASEMSARTELHTHLHDNGIMRMRQVDGVDVPAGGRVTFKPGGHHIMFIGLRKPFRKGESFPVTLTFAKAGKLSVNVTVMGVGAMMMDGDMDKGMNHGEMPVKHDMKPAHGGHHGK